MNERNRTWKLRINQMLTGDRWSYISPFCPMSTPAVSDSTYPAPEYFLSRHLPQVPSLSQRRVQLWPLVRCLTVLQRPFLKIWKACLRHFPNATYSERHSATPLSYTVTVILFPGAPGPLHWSSISLYLSLRTGIRQIACVLRSAFLL